MRGGVRGRWAAAPGCALLLLGPLAPGAAGVSAQEAQRVPVPAAGVPVVVLPTQSARPTPGGAWPAGARSEQEVLDRLDAELAFALGEEREAAAWIGPDRVRERATRNPGLKVEPGRLAYQALLAEPDPRAQLPEPLHGQLRRLAALFDARLAVVPLAVWYEPGPRAEEPRAEEAEAEGEEDGRAVLLVAVVDVRRSAVLWHGRVEGAAGRVDAPWVLTSLALAAVQRLAPS